MKSIRYPPFYTAPAMPENKNRKQTNGDWIRAMSDEELAQFMCKTFMCQINNCPGAELCTTSDGKANGMLKWLRQPVEEG